MGFLRDLGNRLKLPTGEENSFNYERSNAASVLGTTAHPSSGCM